MRKSILLALAALMCASVAGAATLSNLEGKVTGNYGTITIVGTAGLADDSTDVVVAYLKDARWDSYNTDETTYDLGFTALMSNLATAAADSLNYKIEIGPRAAGPFTEIYSMNNINSNLATASSKEIDITTFGSWLRITVKNVSGSTIDSVTLITYPTR